MRSDAVRGGRVAPLLAPWRVRSPAPCVKGQLAVRRTLPSETRQVLALLAQLQSLAVTVASLREAQGRAAQAAAARAAAEHLAASARRPVQPPPAATMVDLLSVPSRATAPGPAPPPTARRR